MKRFVIRNYGPSIQIPYNGQNICLSNDQVIETNDSKLVHFLNEDEQFKDIYVTDRGEELTTKSPVEDFVVSEASSMTVDPDEISYDDMEEAELRALCKDRQLKIKGLKKGGLIEALEEYDAEEVTDGVIA